VVRVAVGETLEVAGSLPAVVLVEDGHHSTAVERKMVKTRSARGSRLPSWI
jgi:hypothetical protein